MDAVNIPSETVPAEMKAGCEQILKRAKELKKAEPVVAYWCCFSAAQKALKVPSRSADGTNFLLSILDALEKMKPLLANNEAVTNEAAGAAYIENFALKVFHSADNDDREGITGKATIRKFVVAGQFIEVLRCFENGMTEEMEQKLQYARWKAADGAKALREGRIPTSGPPLPHASEADPFPTIPVASPGVTQSTLPPVSPPPTNTKLGGDGKGRGSFSSSTRPPMPKGSSPSDTPVGSPRPGGRPNLTGIDTSSHDTLRTPRRNHSSGSGAWSTVATPGLPDTEDGERHFDLPAPQPSAPPLDLPDPGPSEGEKKNVRFLGPDGAPLSPAGTHFTVDSYDAPAAPPPSTFGVSSSSPKVPSTTLPPPPVGSAGNSSSSSNGSQRPVPTANGGIGNGVARPRGDSSGSNGVRPPTVNRGRSDSATRSTAPPPAPPPFLASYPSQPPVYPTPHGLGLTSPPPSAPPPPPVTNLSHKQVEQTQRHAKFAISALEFDDYDTARAELKKALAILGG